MLKLLHISDIHFGMKDLSGERPLLVEPLIAAAHADGIRPDLCVFTGDLAHSGSTEQLSCGEDWLARLVAPWNCPLIIVPGNHDIFRQQTTPKLFRSTASSLEQYSEWRNSPLRAFPHLSNFFTWHKAATQKLNLCSDWSSPFGFRFSTDIHDMRVHVIGINTALFCCNDEDDGSLVADINFLNEELSKINANDEFVIVTMHHPVDSLVLWNRSLLKQRLAQDRGAHLLLHGHIHDPSSVAIADGGGRSLATLAAGAAFQDSPFPKFFSFHQVTFDYPTIETRTYGYSSNSGEWVVDPGLSGKVVARLPRPRSYASTRDLTPSQAQPGSRPPKAPPRPNATQVDVDIRRYREAARDAERRMLAFFSQAETITGFIYAIKSRVKSLDSIRRKYKSRNDKKFYDLKSMADICGVRVVTFYQSNIPNVLSYILHTIQRVTDPRSSPFKHNCVIEIDINTSRPDNDPLSLIGPIRRVVADAGLSIDTPAVSRETGYSSVHVAATVLLNPEVDGISELKVEIQIRSALEDIWGEIDHRLRYGSKRGELGQAWTHHLNVFKGIVDSLVQYLDLIKGHSEEEPAQPPSDLSALRSVAQPSAQVEMLKSLGLPDAAGERLEFAYSLWKSADSTLERGGQPGLLRQAADEFLAVRSEFGSALPAGKLAAEFEYVVTAEAAYLLTHTGDQRDLLEALSLYQNILRERPQDATIHFRQGNVQRQLGNLPASLDNLLKALEIIESGIDPKLNRHHWVYDEARLGLGLTEWRRSYDRSLSQAERHAALRAARASALAVLEHPAEDLPNTRVRAANAYLYYHHECQEQKLLSGEDSANTAIYLPELIEAIENGQSLSIQTRINYIDTALRFTQHNCTLSLPLIDKLEEDIGRLHLVRFPDAKLEPTGTSGWLIEISRFLDDENRDSLSFARSVLDRCRAAR